MPSERQWDAVATITVAGKVAGPFLLGTPEFVSIGRSERAGLQSPSLRIEVPREFARLRCTRKGWMLENEGGTVGSEPRPVRVTGPDIVSPEGALFTPHAFVLLSEGTWTLTWNFGVMVKVVLEPASDHGDVFERAVDKPRRNWGMATMPAEPVRLTLLQRRYMTALFAYLIRTEPEPKDPFAEAARLLGGDAAMRKLNSNRVKSQFHNLTQRINRKRERENEELLRSMNDLGYLLVQATGTLGLDDLED